VRWSRDRDRKGHRIPRRVLVGGRLLGSSRAFPFHEALATVTLAAFSLGMAATLVRAEAERSREGAPHPGRRGRGDRGVRGTIGLLAPWEENAHAPSSRMRSKDGTASREATWQARCPVAVRRSVRECRETLGSPVKCTEPKTPWTSTRMRISQPRSEPGTHEVGVHVNRSGGRSRSDASRVLCSGRSQGLVDPQGASQREARKSRLTGDPSREKANRCAKERSRIKQ